MSQVDWTIRIPKDREKNASDLGELHHQLRGIAKGIQEQVGRELLVVHRYDEGGTLLVMIMHDQFPNIPVAIYHFDVHKCTCINVWFADCDERSWKDGLESFVEVLACAVEQESKRAYSRSIVASTEVAPNLALEEVDKTGKLAHVSV